MYALHYVNRYTDMSIVALHEEYITVFRYIIIITIICQYVLRILGYSLFIRTDISYVYDISIN